VLLTRADALLPSFDAAIAVFQTKLLEVVLYFRQHNELPPGPRLRPLHLQMDRYWRTPAFFGHVVDFRGDVPVVVEPARVQHDLRLDLTDELTEQLLEGYDDPTVVQHINHSGFHCGSYRSLMLTSLWPDHESSIAQWDRLLTDLEAETSSDPPCKLTFGVTPPFAPFVSNPGGAVDKKVDVPGAKQKIRAIEDSSASTNGESVSAWILLHTTWKLQLLAIDDIVNQYARLLPLATILKERIYMFSTDLSRAYRSAGSAYECWWMNGSHIVDRDNNFHWLVDTRLSFGNKKNPLAFSRTVRVLRHMWTRLNARTIPDTATYRSLTMQALVGTSCETATPPLLPRGFTRKNRVHHDHYRAYSELQTSCERLDDITDFTHAIYTVPRPKAPKPSPTPEAGAQEFVTAAVAGHLYTGPRPKSSTPSPTPEASTQELKTTFQDQRRETLRWWDELYRTTTTPLRAPSSILEHWQARSTEHIVQQASAQASRRRKRQEPSMADVADDRLRAGSLHPLDIWLGFRRVCSAAKSAEQSHYGPSSLCAEGLYMDDSEGLGIGLEVSTVSHNNNTFVAETLLNFTSNEIKNAAGAPSLITVYSGLVFNFEVLERPTLSLDAPKVEELKHLLKTFLSTDAAGDRVTVTELRSLVGKLFRAASVVKRGKLYIQGLLNLIRIGCRRARTLQQVEATFPMSLSKWAVRNLRWWDEFWRNDGPPLDFLLPKATFTGDVQGDASGKGYGALCVVGSTMYYFHGLWTAEEKTLLEGGNTLQINYTECLTQWWMLEIFSEFLKDHTVVLECDNLWTVTAHFESRARSRAGAELLERMDLTMARNRIEASLTHLPGIFNRLSDELSRHGASDLFHRLLQSTYNTSNHTSVITEIIDLSHCLNDFPQMRTTAWLSRAVLEQRQ
jgi:uncharacterized protein YbgA (DUF1722 family)